MPLLFLPVRKVKNIKKRAPPSNFHRSELRNEGGEDRQIETKHLFPLWVFHPYEPMRMYWDAVIILVMIYIVIIIPIQVCFPVKSGLPNPLGKIDLVVDALFLIDIFFNFNTGFINHESQFVSSRIIISAKYLKGWFWLDLITSIPFTGFVSERGVTILTKVIRIFRLVKLVRLISMMKVLGKWEENMEVSAASIRVLRFVVLIFVLAHSCACFFVGIARFYRQQDKSYENSYGFDENSWIYRFQNTWDEPQLVIYLRALYWAFTTLTTVGYGDITPLLPLEIGFTIFVQLCGCTLFGFIIGNVASILTRSDSTAVMLHEKLEAVTDYINYRRIPIHLANKIRRHYGYAWKRSQVFKEEEILFELPQALRTECALFIHREIINKVPLLSDLDEDVVPSLVTHLKPAHASHGDVVVMEGIFGSEMYFVSRGNLVVSVATHNVEINELLRVENLYDGSYFAEYAVIMNHIRHPITVIAEAYCDLFVLKRVDFMFFGTTFPKSFSEILQKCKQRYIDLTGKILKKRHHHAFMLQLERGESNAQLDKTAWNLHMKADTLRECEINLPMPDEAPVECGVSNRARRLSIELKSSPVVSFGMRLKYHRLCSHKASSGSMLPPSLPKSKAFVSRKTKFLRAARNKFVTSVKQENVPSKHSKLHLSPYVLGQVMEWKDRARLRVMTKKINHVHDQVCGNSENSQNCADKNLSWFMEQLHSKFQKELQELKQILVSNMRSPQEKHLKNSVHKSDPPHFLDLKANNSNIPEYAAHIISRQEWMEKEMIEIKRMVSQVKAQLPNLQGFGMAPSIDQMLKSVEEPHIFPALVDFNNSCCNKN